MNRLPTPDEILAWLRDNPGQTAKRDIARAFGLKGAAKVELKRLLAEMTARRPAREAPPPRPPAGRPAAGPACCASPAPTATATSGPSPPSGRATARAPRILVRTRRDDPALGAGDRLLGRMTALDGPDAPLAARVIRRIGMGPRRVLGIYHEAEAGGRIAAIDKRTDRDWQVAPGDRAGAREGELVEAEQIGAARGYGLPRARIVARLGDPSAPRVGLADRHPRARHPRRVPRSRPRRGRRPRSPVALGEREDLRALPLVTIDPSDARDHDDAVFAHPDDDPANPGGHVVWVAIADVAHYVRPGTALDREARRRGNSTYFPDRVVPMLPDRLSGDLCSLHRRPSTAPASPSAWCSTPTATSATTASPAA